MFAARVSLIPREQSRIVNKIFKAMERLRESFILNKWNTSQRDASSGASRRRDDTQCNLHALTFYHLVSLQKDKRQR